MLRTIAILATLGTLAAPALASTFWGGTVINVAASDELFVRKWPASTSRIIDSYDNGDSVSMTGRCKNIATNVSFYIDGGQSASRKYNKMSKANVWCQVMSPSARLGWVRGKFVWPE